MSDDLEAVRAAETLLASHHGAPAGLYHGAKTLALRTFQIMCLLESAKITPTEAIEGLRLTLKRFGVHDGARLGEVDLAAVRTSCQSFDWEDWQD